jgi:hypothetical protein
MEMVPMLLYIRGRQLYRLHRGSKVIHMAKVGGGGGEADHAEMPTWQGRKRARSATPTTPAETS